MPSWSVWSIFCVCHSSTKIVVHGVKLNSFILFPLSFREKKKRNNKYKQFVPTGKTFPSFFFLNFFILFESSQRLLFRSGQSREPWALLEAPLEVAGTQGLAPAAWEAEEPGFEPSPSGLGSSVLLIVPSACPLSRYFHPFLFWRPCSYLLLCCPHPPSLYWPEYGQ